MPSTPAILGPNGRPYRPVRAVPPRVRVVRARYDAAQDTDDNSRYWVAADGLSARAANSAEVRTKLRNRSRYERSNNSYYEGIVQTIANDTVGTGPRLQLLTGDQATNRAIEAAFGEWADAVMLAEKLRTLRMARLVDGEAFAVLGTNPGLATPVTLDLRLIEADQVSTPTIDPLDLDAVDGIAFDRYGNPLEYHVLREHPGDSVGWSWVGEYDRIPARFVLHWFRRDRPGQARGVPEITAALLDFGELRRYSKAVLAAAETAADFAAVLFSEMPPDDTTADAEPFETLEIERRMMTTLPAGWKMGQFRAEQPTTTHPDFERTTLTRIIRCLGVPINIALGDSSRHNYASGRLDHQVYYRNLRIDQDSLRRTCLEPLFFAWLDEMSLASDLLLGGPDRLGGWPHRWIWDAPEHVDPEKEANAQEIRLRNYMTTFDDECYRLGLDPDTQAETIAKSLDRFRALGIPLPTTWAVAEMAPATGADGEEGAGVAAGTDVQATALNGAQVESLVGIAFAVANETLPAGTAAGLIAASFPTLSDEQIADILDPLDGFDPAAPEPAAAPPARSPSPNGAGNGRP